MKTTLLLTLSVLAWTSHAADSPTLKLVQTISLPTLAPRDKVMPR